jgi:hypothetical protein
MSEWQLLDDGSFNGVRKYIRAGVESDSVDVKHEFTDVSETVNVCKELQNEGFDRREDMWHAAHIPAQVIYEWIAKYGINYYNPDHRNGVKRLLNSNEYRYLRVRHFII